MLPDDPRQVAQSYDEYLAKWLDDLPEFITEEPDRYGE